LALCIKAKVVEEKVKEEKGKKITKLAIGKEGGAGMDKVKTV